MQTKTSLRSRLVDELFAISLHVWAFCIVNVMLITRIIMIFVWVSNLIFLHFTVFGFMPDVIFFISFNMQKPLYI